MNDLLGLWASSHESDTLRVLLVFPDNVPTQRT
jgi:hypothetical protein